jgi:hypothetical protein
MPFPSRDEDNLYAPPRAPLGSPPRPAPEGFVAIVVSFLVTSTLGVAYILGGEFLFHRGSFRDFALVGIVQSLRMVVIMAVIHSVGYWLYRHQGGRSS